MPRFSILIPTRNRPETLRACIRTCLAQDFDDFEVIVSNNSDVLSEETRSVVAEAQSPKIRHVQPPRPLCMTDNWEFALSHATGEYISVIGDDDGLSLFALRELDRLIDLTSTEVVSWTYASYYWPNMPEQFAHRISIPLSQSTSWTTGRSAISKVISFRRLYFALPTLYNSVVSRALISRIRQRKGRFFFSQCPDIYSGFAVASSVDKFIRSEIPFSVGGMSAKSNGFATLSTGDNDVASDFYSLNSRDGISSHPATPSKHVLSAFVSDSFSRAKENLFPHNSSFRINSRDLLGACLREVNELPPAKASQALTDLSAFFAGDRLLISQIDNARSKLLAADSDTSPNQIKLHPKTFFDGEPLFLDGASFNVADIYDASVLLENLFGYRANGIDWPRLLNANSLTHQARQLRRRISSRVSRLIHKYA